nr:insulinase family protein [Desulfocicer vacuolatum]
MKTGDSLLNYTIVQMESLEDIDGVFYLLEHTPTGARHIHISNKDKENTFGVAFRTVPTDSTGVAHILEHTVLCGSEQFNVRDPFFSMLKRGLSTFMNAFTASDWTMYPFSTQNRKDYYNLMSVYLDAAFFPHIDELSFKQEGHRLETVTSENKETTLEYKGVVYNEMKGAMSSPGQVMGRALMQALYPDTTYGFNSGGEPSVIPTLTHEQLKAFHARYYHPSNAYFYTYGNLPLEAHLKFIQDKVLNRFSRIDPNSAVSPQPRWDKPREFTARYPLSVDEAPDKKYQACVGWLTKDIQDSYEVLIASVLEEILLGNASSPLRQKLIDSGLGTALSDASGFDLDLRDTMFACGLKEIEKSAVKKVETLVLETLEGIVEKGIDPRSVASAIHQIEFNKKEMTNTPYPFGIKLVMAFAGPWIHDGNPVSCLNLNEDLTRLKEDVKQKGFLEGKIREYFLDNPHRVLFTLAPDTEMEAAEAKRVKKELAQIQARLTPEELDKINSDAAMLKKLQESEEDLSVLPTLALEDIPPDTEIIRPDSISTTTSATCYNKATSDILYFTCPMVPTDLPDALIPLVPFFCMAFTGTGTEKRDYADLAALMDLYTGGIGLSAFSGSGFNHDKKLITFMSLHGKALNHNIDKMFDIIAELVSSASFKDLTRLKSLLFQYRAGLESSIVGNGHRYAMSLAGRNFSPAATLGEMWHGISQFQFIKGLTEKIGDAKEGQTHLEQLAHDLDTMVKCLFKRENLSPAIVGDKEGLKQGDKNIARLLSLVPQGDTAPGAPLSIPVKNEFPREGWSTSTSVSFVAQAFTTVRMGHEDAPCLSVIAKLLRSMYLHREIREKGGAYGGFAVYSPEEGTFSFGSYRDPNIERTLDVYTNACEFIAGDVVTDEDVKEAILQVCSEIDKPETPGPASIKAFYREKVGLTDEIRQQFKKALLAVNRQKVAEVARKYFKADDKNKGTAVISSRESLEAANNALEQEGKSLKLIKI